MREREILKKVRNMVSRFMRSINFEGLQPIARITPNSFVLSSTDIKIVFNTPTKTRNTINKHAKKVAREGFSANRKKTL